jgi:hypothetical protein
MGYPSQLLEDGARVEAVPGAESDLGFVLALPLTNYARDRRVFDEAVLRALLGEARSPRTLAELDVLLCRLDVGQGVWRATVAWMLKYGLLRTA